MALDPILWAQKDAPIANIEEWAVLTIMAESADEDGCNAFQATKTIANRCKLSVRTVQRRIDSLVERGLIVLGDQSYYKLLRLPQGSRPVNYDMAIPFEWYGAKWGRVNEWRAEQGRPPLHPTERPPLPPAPAKKKRKDAKDQGTDDTNEGDETQDATVAPEVVQGGGPSLLGGDYKSPPDFKSSPVSESGDDYKSPPASESPHVQESPGGVTSSQEGGVRESPNPPHDPPHDPPPSFLSPTADAVDDEQTLDAFLEADSPADAQREDVERLCELLRLRIVENGYKPEPKVTAEWRRSCRLMLDRDGRTEEEVRGAIEWATQDDFWRKNARSMQKVREKFDQMREDAIYKQKKAAAALEQSKGLPGRGHNFDAALERAAERDRQLGLNREDQA